MSTLPDRRPSRRARFRGFGPVVAPRLPHQGWRRGAGRHRRRARQYERRVGATSRPALGHPEGSSEFGRRRPEAPHPAEGGRRAQPRPARGRFREGRRPDRRQDDRADRAEHLRRRRRSGRLLGHDRHARIHHHAPSSVRDPGAQHHRGRPSQRRLARGDLRVGGAEHLDDGTDRGAGDRAWDSGQGHLGLGTRPVRSRGLLYLGGRGLLERDQRGDHVRDGHLAGQSHAGAHRRDDQRADGFRPPDGLRLQRRNRPECGGHPVRIPRGNERHDQGDRPDRKDVLQFERSVGDARLCWWSHASLPGRQLHRVAARPLVRRVDQQPRQRERDHPRRGR